MNTPQLDDVLQFLISLLRSEQRASEFRGYGYDVYLPKVGEVFAREVGRLSPQDPHGLTRRAEEISPILYDAAWVLCRRGILRPGVRRQREQATDDGSGGNGYSTTSVGRTWLFATEQPVFVPVEPSRVAGTASEISEFEAYEALARLLRFAHFASDHRNELTGNP
jgi:hypothetical protein